MEFWWYCNIDDSGETWTGSWWLKARKETGWCIGFFLHVLEANCIMFWEFLVGNLDETQCWTPILTLGNWSLATWKESKHAQNLQQKKIISMHGYCKQRPVHSVELGCFSIHKGFLYIFLFQDFEPNGLSPKKSSNRRALGIEGWGTKFSGGKLRAKTGGIGIEYLDLFFRWWFCTDSTMVQHYSTTIWGNINCVFSQAFSSANPRQDGSDMNFEIRQRNYFTCIGINYMILWLIVDCLGYYHFVWWLSSWKFWGGNHKPFDFFDRNIA